MAPRLIVVVVAVFFATKASCFSFDRESGTGFLDGIKSLQSNPEFKKFVAQKFGSGASRSAVSSRGLFQATSSHFVAPTHEECEKLKEDIQTATGKTLEELQADFQANVKHSLMAAHNMTAAQMNKEYEGYQTKFNEIKEQLAANGVDTTDIEAKIRSCFAQGASQQQQQH